jgi:hypothetical protein
VFSQHLWRILFPLLCLHTMKSFSQIMHIGENYLIIMIQWLCYEQWQKIVHGISFSLFINMLTSVIIFTCLISKCRMWKFENSNWYHI